MSPRQLKTGFFILTAVNAFATSYYFNYLFFYLQKQFGFGNLGNLTFSALNGFVYIFASLYGGRFAQSRGYFLALNLGFIGMVGVLLAGLFLPTVPGQLLVLLLWTVSVCFTWPTLEALVCEGEDLQGMPRMVGLYNIVWASGAALAFFSGGAMAQVLGWKSLFWLPAILHLAQLGLALWLEKKHGPAKAPAGSPLPSEGREIRGEGSAEGGGTPAPLARSFLRLAWVANPLAYMAINTALPLIPYVAQRLELSPMFAGFFCSAWMFARLATFLLLRRWTGWHYRLDWLLWSYLLLIVSFAGLLLAPFLWAVVLAEIVRSCTPKASGRA